MGGTLPQSLKFAKFKIRKLIRGNASTSTTESRDTGERQDKVLDTSQIVGLSIGGSYVCMIVLQLGINS